MDNHYIKYLKYKKKYLLAGGNYKCNDNLLSIERCVDSTNGTYETIQLCEEHCLDGYKDNYIELYYLLLRITEKQIINDGIVQKIRSLCKLLFDNLVSTYDKLNETDQRILKYNIRFIISVASMLISEHFITNLDIELKSIDFNKKLKLDDDILYYLEDCYTDDLDLFLYEHDNLLKTGKSSFFYRSNLVNIGLLFKCFNDECIDKITAKSGFYYRLKIELLKNDKNLIYIYKNFQESKYNLINLLLLAYSDFDYSKIKKLYLSYLDFYYKTFIKLKLVFYNRKEYETNYIKLIDIITNSGKEYICYLSCNLPSILRFEKFEMTQILISYIGFRTNDDSFYSSSEIVLHDFIRPHNQYGRKTSYSKDEIIQLRELFKKIYKIPDHDRYIILNFIHNKNYEYYHPGLDKLSVKNILQFIIDSLLRIIRHPINYTIYRNLENLIILYLEKNKNNENFNKIVKNRGVSTQSEINPDDLYIKLGLTIIDNDVSYTLSQQELCILEEALRPLTEPYIYDELIKYINNPEYIKKYDLSNDELTKDEIKLFRIIYSSNIEKNKDVLIIILDFLYKEYNSLFTNNHIYTNIKNIYEK